MLIISFPGQKADARTLRLDPVQIILDTSRLAPGIYTLRISEGGKIVVKRLMIVGN